MKPGEGPVLRGSVKLAGTILWLFLILFPFTGYPDDSTPKKKCSWTTSIQTKWDYIICPGTLQQREGHGTGTHTISHTIPGCFSGSGSPVVGGPTAGSQTVGGSMPGASVTTIAKQTCFSPG